MRHVLSFTLVLLVVAAPLAVADPAVPMILTHEGRLLTDGETPVDSQVEMTFLLSETDNSGISDPKWSETHRVNVAKGFYAVVLGDTRPGKGGSEIPAALLIKSEVYLSVKIAGVELQPRMRLGTAAYAIRAAQAVEATHVLPGGVDTAALADGSVTLDKLARTQGKFVGLDADTLDGLDSAAFAPAAIVTSIDAIKTSVGTNVAGDVAAVKTDLAAVKGDVGGVKGDVSTSLTKLDALAAKIGDTGSTTVAAQLSAIASSTGTGLVTSIGNVNTSVGTLSGTVGTINTNVAGLPAILGSPASGTSLTTLLQAVQASLTQVSYGWNAANPGLTCKDILQKGGSRGDGYYWIKPDPNGAAFQVVCDMTRDGGGFTLAMKVWYRSNCAGQAGAVGTIADALGVRTSIVWDTAGGCYKLADATINAIIGPSKKFDVLADQVGHNHYYASGNWEYTVMRNYTATFSYAGLVPESTTPTQLISYRKSDNAAMWIGNLGCGYAGGYGINCFPVNTGYPSANPQGGTGCTNNGGAPGGNSVSTTWHHWFMGENNTDTYVYICNGAQHSSGTNMAHRFWFR